MSRRRGDRGQAVPLLAVLVAFALAAVAGVARLGAAAVDAARARTAADAAALAGVHGGRAAAARLAASNGGVLTSFDIDGQSVVVAVSVGQATVRARAGIEQGEAIPG